MTFGEKLQELRKATGLSQSALATRAGTPLDSLRNWEQDRVLPKIDAAVKLARALGVSLDEFADCQEKATAAGGAATEADRQGRAPAAKKPRGRKGK